MPTTKLFFVVLNIFDTVLIDFFFYTLFDEIFDINLLNTN
jgi:hypothetical protein